MRKQASKDDRALCVTRDFGYLWPKPPWLRWKVCSAVPLQHFINCMPAVLARLDQHDAIIDQRGAIIDQHDAIIDQHAAIIDRHDAIIDQHDAMIDQRGAIIDQLDAIIDQHAAIIDRHNARLDRLEIKNAEMKEGMKEENNRIDSIQAKIIQLQRAMAG